MTYVRYIDKTREYYLSEGYETPYRWAHFDDIPFTPLRKPLAESRVALITTSEMAIRTEDGAPEEVEEDFYGNVYSLPSDTPIAQLYSRKDSYDRYATTLDDVDSYLPLTRLREFVAEGRIGSLAPRFHMVYSQYSQRKTSEVDAPEILRRCVEDEVDVALLAAV
jgi:hypothetical protein